MLSLNMLRKAKQLITACEVDLKRKLSTGEKRDLLMDNTNWHSEDIKEIVRLVEQN